MLAGSFVHLFTNRIGELCDTGNHITPWSIDGMEVPVDKSGELIIANGKVHFYGDEYTLPKIYACIKHLVSVEKILCRDDKYRICLLVNEQKLDALTKKNITSKPDKMRKFIDLFQDWRKLSLTFRCKKISCKKISWMEISPDKCDINSLRIPDPVKAFTYWNDVREAWHHPLSYRFLTLDAEPLQVEQHLPLPYSEKRGCIVSTNDQHRTLQYILSKYPKARVVDVSHSYLNDSEIDLPLCSDCVIINPHHRSWRRLHKSIKNVWDRLWIITTAPFKYLVGKESFMEDIMVIMNLWNDCDAEMLEIRAKDHRDQILLGDHLARSCEFWWDMTIDYREYQMNIGTIEQQYHKFFTEWLNITRFDGFNWRLWHKSTMEKWISQTLVCFGLSIVSKERVNDVIQDRKRYQLESATKNGNKTPDALKSTVDIDIEEDCVICFEQSDCTLICRHSLCKDCVIQTLAHSDKCPICRHQLTPTNIILHGDSEISEFLMNLSSKDLMVTDNPLLSQLGYPFQTVKTDHLWKYLLSRKTPKRVFYLGDSDNCEEEWILACCKCFNPTIELCVLRVC